MVRMIVFLLVFVFVGLFAGCTVEQGKITATEDVKTIMEIPNKQIPFERADPEKLDKDIYNKNDFLKYVFGYNYWKTTDGYIFVISGGPAGTPGNKIAIKSVEEDKGGNTVITVEQLSPPQGKNQVQVVTFQQAVYKVHASNEDFIVRNEKGIEFPRYPKNEFTVKGTVTDIITLENYLYPPHYIRVIPDVEGNRMNGSYFVDFVQFGISNAASRQAKELSIGDKVSIVYNVGGISSYNVKSLVIS